VLKQIHCLIIALTDLYYCIFFPFLFKFNSAVNMSTDTGQHNQIVITDDECQFIREAVDLSEGKLGRKAFSKNAKASEYRVKIARKTIAKWQTSKTMKRVEALHLLRKCRKLLINCGLIEIAEQARDSIYASNANVSISASIPGTSLPFSAVHDNASLASEMATSPPHPVSKISALEENTTAVEFSPGSVHPESSSLSLVGNNNIEAMNIDDEAVSPRDYESSEYPNVPSYLSTLPDEVQDDFEETFPYLAEGLIASEKNQGRKLDFCQVLRHWATQTQPTDTDLTCLLQCIKIAGVTEIKPEKLPNKGSQLMAVSQVFLNDFT
jgi:hypothetical protein